VLIINPATLKREQQSHWVRVGQEYTVLEVIASPDSRVSLRIDLGSEPPGIFDSEMFESMDATIPSIWTAQVAPGGTLRLGPSRWLEPGFWEKYFDDDPAAVAVFEEDRAILLTETQAS
jgi:hypothetical protein